MTPRVIGQAKERAEAKREYEKSLLKWKHGNPLTQSPIRMPISDLKIEVKGMRVARIKRDPKGIATATLFVEGTTDTMNSAFRTYLKEIDDGGEDTGFWYSALGVEGERIKVITVAPGGATADTIHLVDAVSLAPPPHQEVFSLDRIPKVLPQN